jgi:hypothetical protein
MIYAVRSIHGRETLVQFPDENEMRRLQAPSRTYSTVSEALAKEWVEEGKEHETALTRTADPVVFDRDKEARFCPNDPDGHEVFAGRADEVSERLRSAGWAKTVAVTLPDTVEVSDVAAFLTAVTPMIGEVVRQRNGKSVEALVAAILPAVAVTPTVVREASMQARARRAVLESGDLLLASQVSRLAGFSEANPSTQPNRWKRDGLVFAVRHNGVDYYPAYCLDPERCFRPREGVAEVIAELRKTMSDWDMAYWFASANGFLGGMRPAAVVAFDPARVLAAARDETAGIEHG